MEIIITIFIVIFALFVIFRNIKKSSNGKCNCGHCSKSCPIRKDKETDSK
ncbi:MAG: FeoB-associated Cys-rich membrane protein [Clostridium sp.]|nr:FeoB-associated Cys-rich membrane protein [Clostridium sp.]